MHVCFNALTNKTAPFNFHIHIPPINMMQAKFVYESTAAHSAAAADDDSDVY